MRRTVCAVYIERWENT